MYNNYINYIGNLIADLFKIWSYDTFGVLLAMCGVYMCVKLVRGMFNLL